MTRDPVICEIDSEASPIKTQERVPVEPVPTIMPFGSTLAMARLISDFERLMPAHAHLMA